MRVITKDNFSELYAKATNYGSNVKEVSREIEILLEEKKNGMKCDCCGGEIWVVGTFLSGYKSCHFCTTSEMNDCSDFEVE